MRFDSTLFYHVGDPYSWELLFDEMHETTELLDELGFTGIWLAEHHFAWDGWYRSASNPLLLGADIARYSDRLRLGQCGAIVPDWHPLRLAEDIAFLDQMTKGRVDVGIAPGINSRACRNFHPAGDRRDHDLNRALYEENVDILLKALTQKSFSHKGRFHSFPAPGWTEANPLAHDPDYHAEDGELVKIGIFPGPYQKPRPPIWAMAESLSSHEYCARLGIGTMCQNLSLGRIRENWTRYQEVASDTQGRAVGFGEGLAVMRVAYVAETMDEAVEAAAPGMDRLARWASGMVHRMRPGIVTKGELDDGDLELGPLEFQLKHDTALVGTPDTVARQVERLRDEVDCQHLALFLNIPGLSFDQVKNSLRLFATQVAPRFAN